MLQHTGLACCHVTELNTCACRPQVQCNISAVPAQLCGLSRLQLLDLSHNRQLALEGYKALAQAPLHKVHKDCQPASLWCCRHMMLMIVYGTARGTATHATPCSGQPSCFVQLAALQAAGPALQEACASQLHPSPAAVSTASVPAACHRGDSVPHAFRLCASCTPAVRVKPAGEC